MKVLSKFHRSLALALLFAMSGQAQSPNLVNNGSFEADVMTANDPDGQGGLLHPIMRYIPEHQATITGWTFASTGLGENSYLSKDYYPDGSYGYGPMADGNYGLRLNVGDSISQSLLFSQAGSYSLSFTIDRWQVGYNFLYVDFGATRIGVEDLGSTINYSFDLNVAANSTVVLGFGFYPMLSDGTEPYDEDYWGSGAMLDNIQVTSNASVPEPSAFSLLAIGLGVVFRRRRRTV